MAYTQADLDALDAAIASGEKIVRVENRLVEYRSVAELQAARAHVQQVLTTTAAGPSGRRTAFRFRFTTSRGD
jgi:hypothetical protein